MKQFRYSPRHGRTWSWKQRPLVAAEVWDRLAERFVGISFLGIGFALGLGAAKLAQVVLT